LGILIVGAVLYVAFVSGSSTGFTLVVNGAPPDSQIFVNGSSRDAVVADGGLKVVGLKPGPAYIRVSHEGYADFTTRVTGVKGEVQSCEAQLLHEIDYNGEMVPIPAGEFVMGDDNHETDERPAHPVNLPAYYIDKYEVTNAQYKKFCEDTRHPNPPNPPFDPNYFLGKPDYPVLGVTIDEARSYASWAGKRLPTEEEWEKAAAWDAVAQKKRQFPWGDEFDAGHANIGTDQPNPVTQPNGDRSQYGVLNMAGNAGEWVEAPYKPYKGSEMLDPEYAKDEIVMRGGTFYHASTQGESRASYRNHLPRVFPKGLSVPVGIRCVVPADDPRIQQFTNMRSK
jgi:formylglycine-generating enzyme required for sulfatase activity